MPLALSRALDSLEVGPPGRKPGQSDSDWTRDRMLWWATNKKLLVKHGANLDAYLDRMDIIVLDKLQPRIEKSADEDELKVSFSTDDVKDEVAFNQALRGYNPRAGRDPTARWVDSNGDRRTQRIALTKRGRRAAAYAHHALLNYKKMQPHLRDAPDTVFPPELFDLSQYSDRVIGVRALVYRVSRSQVLGTDGRTHTRIHLKSEESSGPPPLTTREKKELAETLLEAARRGKSYVRYNDFWVRVPSPTLAESFSKQVEREKATIKGELVPALNLEEETYTINQDGRAVTIALGNHPPGLSPEFRLMPHQVEGWEWLAGHAALSDDALDHGLLADDMGLGKTLQVLSLMALLEQKGKLRPSLVVAPLSLLENWCMEARKFFPNNFGRILKYTPPLRRTNASALEHYDIVLLSYETLRTRQLVLGKVRWRLMVLDESHQIRNPRARTTHAVLAMDATRRLALTGTPVQNSLVDLWSQFDWLCPGFLHDLKNFKKKVRVDDEASLNSLRRKIAPRLLRRMKESVASHLPPKVGDNEPVNVTMASWQAELYDSVLRDRKPGRGSAFGTLHRLFAVCNQPESLADDVPLLHPKLAWLLNTLRDIQARGQKVLVFADRHSIQKRIMELVEDNFDLAVDYINGTVEAGYRLFIVERFNRAEGFQVLVLGPKAAGVGLNLTGANHVIHFTRHWNPATEAQATDRAHRIGQKLPVRVYLPTMLHPNRVSIEQSLHVLLNEKRALAEDVVVPTSKLDVRRELERILMEGDEDAAGDA